MQYKFAEVGDDVYFWFAANETDGGAGDGASPTFDVRLAGAAADAAPTASGTPSLLSHANYPAGCYEIKVDTDGYDAGEYAVFCSLTISTVNPSGFVGSVKLRAVGAAALSVGLIADAITADKIADNAFANEHFANGALTSTEITSAAGCAVASIANDAITAASIQNGAIDLATFAADCKTGSALKANVETVTNDAITAAAIANGAIDANTFAAGALDAVWSTAARTLTANTNLANLEVDLTKIHGTALTETAGQLAGAFTTFFDVATPVLTCESVNQAQDNATTAEIKTALEAAGSSLAQILEDTGTTLNAQINKMVIALVNKKIVRKTAGGAGEDVGDTDLYTDAGDLAASIDKAFSDDGTFVSQKALVVP